MIEIKNLTKRYGQIKAVNEGNTLWKINFLESDRGRGATEDQGDIIMKKEQIL